MRRFLAGAVAVLVPAAVVIGFVVALGQLKATDVTPPHRCFEDEVIVVVVGEFGSDGWSNQGPMIGATTCVTIDDYRWVSP